MSFEMADDLTSIQVAVKNSFSRGRVHVKITAHIFSDKLVHSNPTLAPFMVTESCLLTSGHISLFWTSQRILPKKASNAPEGKAITTKEAIQARMKIFSRY